MLQTFAGGDEQVKIIDFGIAKLKNSTVAPSTVTGSTAGTVAYSVTNGQQWRIVP